MIYLICNAYIPNTAEVNRFLAFVKGLKEEGMDFKVIYCHPSKNFDRQEDRIIDIEYLWKGEKKRYQWINIVKYILWKRGICRLTFNHFCSKLKKGDKVVCFSGAMYIHSLLRCNGIELYAERTEHPEIVGRLNTGKQMLQYLNDCRRLSGLFVISRPLKDYFSSVGVDSEKIHIINMIVDQSRFQGITKQQVKQKYIAYCGTVINSKDGVDDLIKSFAIVVRSVPDIMLYIIGPCPSVKAKEGNIKLIDDFGLTDKIVLTGLKPASEIPQLLMNAEVLVLARPDSIQATHGFPTKLGEYLLTKNPVVITRTGDIPHFLKDGYSALLCESRNYENIADRIIWALQNAEKAKRIGENGYHIALENFNSLKESKKIYKILMNS